MDLKSLVFVSGKGGTGKTTMALILARYLALKSKKVLFVELSRKSSAVALLNQKVEPTQKPQTLPFGFDWCRLEGIDCLIEYVNSFSKLEKLTQSFFENSMIESLISVAPGLNDLALLGKLTSHLRHHGPSFNYDHIIVDSPSTGSFSSFLKAPSLLGGSVKSGPLHTQSEGIMRALQNPLWVQYFFVSLYEELPVDELIETYRELSPHFKNQVFIMMNKGLNLSEIKGRDSTWIQFVSNLLKDEKKQLERILELECIKYSQPLFTSPFKDYLFNVSGDSLKVISKN